MDLGLQLRRGIREGAWVAELTGMLTLTGWPKGMGHCPQGTSPPRAQLPITDPDGLRVTAFATGTTGGQLPDLELRRRRRVRAEDRIKCTTGTGLRNLPLHSFTQNQLRRAIVTLAAELTAWIQLLASTRTNTRRGNLSGCGCGCSRSPFGSPGTAERWC